MNAPVRREVQRTDRLVQATLVIAYTLLVSLNLAVAQDQQAEDELLPLPAEVAAGIDQRLSDIALQEADIGQLESRVASSEGLTAQLLELRRDRLWTTTFQDSLTLAKIVADRRDAGYDVSMYENLIVSRLSELTPKAIVAIQRARSRIEFPTTDEPPEKFVVQDQKLFRAIRHIDDIYTAFIDSLGIASRYNIGVAPARDFMTGSIVDSAANRSIFLDKAIDDVATMRAAAATLQNNTELAAWLSAAEARVRLAADAMQEMIGLMNGLGLDTRQYRQQVLTATGEITTDVLDVGIMASLAKEWTTAMGGLAARDGPRFVLKMLLVLVILFIFFQFSKLVRKGVERALASSRFHISHLLRRMIISTVRNLVVFLGILVAISQLGISLGPLLAGLGIAGFIVGFALQDTLSNFVSGIMILLYRPFDVGDVVEAGGVRGTVGHMSLVNTTIMTFDNQKLVVPNNKIWGSVITNVTAQQTRRVDLVFGVSYGENIDKAMKVLREILDAHEAVLDDPEPTIRLHELADSSVNFIVRPWVKTADYWNTYWDITEAVKRRFDELGIAIPFPQRDVHIFQQHSG